MIPFQVVHWDCFVVSVSSVSLKFSFGAVAYFKLNVDFIEQKTLFELEINWEKQI